MSGLAPSVGECEHGCRLRHVHLGATERSYGTQLHTPKEHLMMARTQMTKRMRICNLCGGAPQCPKRRTDPKLAKNNPYGCGLDVPCIQVNGNLECGRPAQTLSPECRSGQHSASSTAADAILPTAPARSHEICMSFNKA